MLLITQSNGAYGRADSKTLSIGAPGYMASLSPIYAGLANGTAVQAAIRAARIPGRVGASEGVDPQTGAYTPFVTLTAVAPTATDAGKLSEKAVAAFRSYVSQMGVEQWRAVEFCRRARGRKQWSATYYRVSAETDNSGPSLHRGDGGNDHAPVFAREQGSA